MECLGCGAEATVGKAMCENCLHTPRAKPQFPGRVDSIPSTNYLPYVAGILIFVLLTIFAYSVKGKPIPFKGVLLNTKDGAKSELCLNKKGCIAVFVAPWCSSCRAHIGLLNEMATAARKTDLGLEVIVGWSDEAQIRDFAREINAKVFLDIDNQFRSRLSFSSVPRWFAVNSQQEITNSFFPSYIEGTSATEKLNYIVTDKASNLSDLLRN